MPGAAASAGRPREQASLPYTSPRLPNTSTTFTKCAVGFPWASYVVALGALLGIVTGVLANIMGGARILCSLARTHLAPPLFGAVSRRVRTGGAPA